MSEWWTYRLGDFLMFSPATYWRMVENYQRDIWPAQVLGLFGGFAALWLTTSRHPSADRLQALILAIAWAWVGWGFHWQNYSTINWSAIYLAVAFAIQTVLLVGVASSRSNGMATTTGHRQKLGWFLALAGLVMYPLVGAWAGRPFDQTEVFGVSPEPTALGSLGLLLARSRQPTRPVRWALAIIPVLSLLTGAATLIAMANVYA